MRVRLFLPFKKRNSSRGRTRTSFLLHLRCFDPIRCSNLISSSNLLKQLDYPSAFPLPVRRSANTLPFRSNDSAGPREGQAVGDSPRAHRPGHCPVLLPHHHPLGALAPRCHPRERLGGEPISQTLRSRFSGCVCVAAAELCALTMFQKAPRVVLQDHFRAPES